MTNGGGRRGDVGREQKRAEEVAKQGISKQLGIGGGYFFIYFEKCRCVTKPGSDVTSRCDIILGLFKLSPRLHNITYATAMLPIKCCNTELHINSEVPL